MPVFMMRTIVDGKIIGHPVEADTAEEAEKKFQEALPFLLEQKKDEAHETLPASYPSVPPVAPVQNHEMNGRKFLSLEFQCSSCGTILSATFKDGYLQIDPCPTCLGELLNIVEASKRFTERKSGSA